MQALLQRSNSITYSMCVSVGSGIQHAMRMLRIVICVLSEFSSLLHNRYNFLKSKILNIKCVF